MIKKDEKKQEEQQRNEKIEELENQLKRSLADYQNLEKRVSDEKREWIVSANKALLLRILPVLDTLRMASDHSQDENLRISLKQFEDVLKGEGITKIDTGGQDFNPQIMECVLTEQGEENKVIEELQTGYMLRDKVLRPARVKVGKQVENSKS